MKERKKKKKKHLLHSNISTNLLSRKVKIENRDEFHRHLAELWIFFCRCSTSVGEVGNGKTVPGNVLGEVVVESLRKVGHIGESWQLRHTGHTWHVRNTWHREVGELAHHSFERIALTSAADEDRGEHEGHNEGTHLLCCKEVSCKLLERVNNWWCFFDCWIGFLY